MSKDGKSEDKDGLLSDPVGRSFEDGAMPSRLSPSVTADRIARASRSYRHNQTGDIRRTEEILESRARTFERSRQLRTCR